MARGPSTDAAPRPPLPPWSEREQQRFLVGELERRIAELERTDEAEFGRFTVWDWLICLVGAVALPYLALLWFSG